MLCGVVLLLSGIAYFILAKAIGNDVKGRMSIMIYLAAIPLAFVAGWLALALYVFVAIMWLVPDWRIEKTPTP